MVKYRPHRGALCDAMAEMRIFDSVEDMFHYIVEDWKAYGNPFDIGDLTITCDEGKDERINWKEGRYVCTRRMREKIFDTPQCIGMCSIESQNGDNNMMNPKLGISDNIKIMALIIETMMSSFVFLNIIFLLQALRESHVYYIKITLFRFF